MLVSFNLLNIGYIGLSQFKLRLYSNYLTFSELTIAQIISGDLTETLRIFKRSSQKITEKKQEVETLIQQTHLGIYDLFGRDKVFDIQDGGYIPKPEAKTFDLMVNKFGINPKETIYIEDIA